MPNTLIVWQPSFAINICPMDRHHKLFARYLNELFHVVQCPILDDQIQQTVANFSDYAHFHFGEEEKLMQQYAYPEIEPHRNQHTLFTTRIHQLQSSPISLQKQNLPDALRFYKKWFLYHIQTMDRKYAIFLLENGYCDEDHAAED